MFRPVFASVAVLACGLVAGCEPTETAPATAGPASAQDSVSSPAAANPPLGPEVVLTMTCSALSASEGFTREVKLAGGNGVYTWTRGARDAARYEYWEMKLDSADGFTVTGEYVEGAPGLKPITFTGTISDGVVSGQGTRGPRKCTITT